MVLVVLVGMGMLRRGVMSDLLVRDMQEILYDEMGSLGLKRDWGRDGSVSYFGGHGLYFIWWRFLHKRGCRAGP